MYPNQPNPQNPGQPWRQQGAQGAGSYASMQPQGGTPQPQPGSYSQPGYPQPQQPGYSQPQPGYPQPQPGYYAQPQPGYSQSQPGYSQPQQPGYSQPQPGYPQQPGYSQPQQPGYYAQPQPGYGQQSQPGFAQPVQNYGAPPQQGVWPQQEQPYNGPQKAPGSPVRLLSENSWMLVVFCGFLPVLFVAQLVLSQTPLRWVFAGLTAVSLLWMWIRPVFATSTKATLTVLYLAAVIVAAVSGLSGGNRDAQVPPTAAPVSAQVTVESEPGEDIGVLGTVPTPGPNTGAAEGSLADDPSVERAKTFLYFWQVNELDSMLPLCAPSWVRSLSSATDSKGALYGLLKGRYPVDYHVTNMTGTLNDDTRTATVEADIAKFGAQGTYQLKMVLLRENGEWYIDPRSLETHEATPSPTNPSAMITQPPPPNRSAEPNTKLYYNPKGGTRYHLDQNCKTANERYLPFAGVFTYSQINDAPYKDLQPCLLCGSPLRP